MIGFRTGRELQAARTLAGVTQAQLAKEAGCHAKTIAYWERRGDARSMHHRDVITTAFARYGVFFLPGDLPGMRLGEPVRKIVQIMRPEAGTESLAA